MTPSTSNTRSVALRPRSAAYEQDISYSAWRRGLHTQVDREGQSPPDPRFSRGQNLS